MSHPAYTKARDLIKNKLFPRLRKRGFIARMNFSCCASCGSYELTQEAKKRQISKVVFYHRQAEDHFKRDGKVYLMYFSMLDDDSETTTVGGIVTEIAKECGLKVEWDGSPSKALCVTYEV